MNRNRNVALLAVFSLTFAGAAFGDSLSETCSIGPSNTDFLATPLACGQFDTSGGATLTEIDITLNGSDTGGISLTNTSGGTDSSLSGTITTSYSLDSALAGFSFPTPLFTIVLSVSGTNVAPGDTVANLAMSNTNSNGPQVNTTNFVPYSGTGFFDILLDTGSLLSITPATGTLINAASDTVAASADVTFDYTPAGGTSTPEPGTALLLGIGTAFVLFGARRRKA
jgi:hypothetical protein